MFAYSLQTLLQTEDGSYAFFDCKDEDAYDPATSFFFDRLMPVIQPMVTAKCVEDRAASFDCFEKVCCYLPQTPLLNLITKKKVWGCFEKAMRLSLKQRSKIVMGKLSITHCPMQPCTSARGVHLYVHGVFQLLYFFLLTASFMSFQLMVFKSRTLAL